MSPLPLPSLNIKGLVNRLLSALSSLSSLLKPKPSNHPLSPSFPEHDETFDVIDPVVSPPSPPPTKPPQLPGGFDLKPPGPEKEPWSKTHGLLSTPEYRELTSNPWIKNRKRSVHGQEPLAMAMSRTHIGSPAPRLPEREYRLNHSQELSLVTFILASMLLAAASIWAMVKIKRKLCRRADRSLV